jgi:protein-disulfide isomerase
MKKYISAIIIAIGIFGGTATGLWLSGRSGSIVDAFRSKPALTLKNAPAGAPDPAIKGSDAAPVTIEEFADFQCEPCRHMRPEIKKVEAEYGDRVKVVFRQYPLEMHPNAVPAAKAAESAGKQGHFWEMHDMLYEKQSEWEDLDNPVDKFKEYAADLKLDMDRFVADMSSTEIADRIAADQKRGDAAGVEGTPTLFVNGTAITDDGLTPEGIRSVINGALAK